MAFAIAESKSVAHPFDKNKGMAGPHWLQGFLDRNHQALSVREPEATSMCLAVGFNKTNVDRFVKGRRADNVNLVISLVLYHFV